MNVGSNLSPPLKYCLHFPDNNVDAIKLSVGENDVHLRSVYFQTKVNVEIESKGNLITTGVDADNQNISVSLSGAQCNTTLTGLLGGKALVTLSACKKGSTELIVKLVTQRGVEIDAKTNLRFTDDLNVVLFSPLKEHVREKLGKSGSIGGTKVRLIHNDGSFYLATRQSHVFFYVETSSNDVIFDQYIQAQNIPSIVLDSHYENQPRLDGFNTTMFLSLPHTSNLYLALLDERVQNSSSGSTSRIVLIRTKDSVSYSDLYAIHRSNLNLYRDIVVSSSPSSKTVKDQLGGIPANTTVIVFLDSYRTSIVLREAIRLRLTPNRGYLWISVSSRFVVSNSFMRESCLNMHPQCHDVFDSMWNIFHTDELLDCPKSPEAYSTLASPITNLTDSVHRSLIPVVIEEVRIVLDAMLGKMVSANRSFDTQFFYNYTSSVSCLPHGSGLVFKPKNLYIQENFPTTDIMCQPGWTGPTCSIPYCTTVSCNQTHGQCIAPEVCKCVRGRFGRSCNGDCASTCVNGVCNDGMFGDGTCRSCNWLYLGDYCDEKTIILGFVAAAIGTTVCVAFLMMYVVRLIQTQEQNAVAEIEAVEVDYSMTWDDLETYEDVDFSTKVVRRQLQHKFQYTSYRRGSTFTGQSVFVKCIEKPQFQITLGIKNELQQICQLSHNNIEQLMGIILGHKLIGVVTPTANMGSLYDVLHEKNILITWDVRYSMMQDVCRGMTYLHDVAKIKHGRLKSTNCVIFQGNFYSLLFIYSRVELRSN